MKNKKNKVSSILIVFCLVNAFIFPSFRTLAISTNYADHTARLNRASELVSSKHYRRGYLQYKKMAQHGCPFSQCILGIMHQKGVGTKQSFAQALYWFQKSAQQGFSDAENRLGLMYYNGNGVKRNLALAKQWLSRAADHGAEGAKELLAKIPNEPAISNQIAQIPQNTVSTVENIHESWQGYGNAAKEIEQISTIAAAKQ